MAVQGTDLFVIQRAADLFKVTLSEILASQVTEDFDAIAASGLYRNTTTVAVGAPTASVNWLVQTLFSNANNAAQLAIRDGVVAVRTKSGVSTYGAWRFLTANFTDTLPGMVPASGGGTTNFLRADGTFAAPPSGGGGVVLNSTMMLNSPTGEYVGNLLSGNLATVGMAANREEIAPFYAPYSFSIDQALVSISVGGAADTFCKVRIYAADANGRPTTLLAASADINAVTVNTNPGALSFNFTAGTLYWIGVWTQGLPQIRCGQPYSSTPLTWNAAGTPVRESILRRTATWGTSTDWSYGAGQHTAQNVPLVLMRIA